MVSPDKNSPFHTDQNRWDRKDWDPERKSKEDEYMDFIDDNEMKESLMGHPPSEFDEGLALDYHEDDHPDGIHRIRTDEELERVVKELLRNSNRIDARDITVTVDKSNVTLSGTVRTQFERDYAVSVVKLVNGIGEVHPDIIVKRNQGILPTDIGRNP